MKLEKGMRIEIPVHYDAWMRGAKFGIITQFRKGENGISDHWKVKMDHPQMKRRVRLWSIDFDYCKVLA